MSRRGLHNALAEHLNTSLGEKLRSLRIAHAQKLLSESGEKVEIVARKSGYLNLNTFFTAFRKSVGVRPLMTAASCLS